MKYIHGESGCIQRSYEDFFELHLQLLSMADDSIPDLPGGLRVVGEKAAKERTVGLQEYVEVWKLYLMLEYFGAEWEGY